MNEQEVRVKGVPRVAVVGAGYWGKNLVRVFHELGALGAICEINPALRAKFADAYPEPILDNFEAVLADPSLSAVVIAAPAVTHYQLARTALLRDKDVFVEKPLALKVEEGEELVRLAGERGRVLMIGHILNYHPAVIKLKELINQGVLGRINYLYSNRLNFGRIRTEENILWSFAPHDISVMLALLNEEPTQVTCRGAAYLQPEIFDLTLTHFTFQSGAQAHIFVSWLHPYKEQKLVVAGSEKMALFDDATEEKLFLYHHRVAWEDRIPTALKASAEPVPLEMTEPLRCEAEHFLQRLADRQPPRTDGREGLRVLRILDRCQSALTAPPAPAAEMKTVRPYTVHPSAYVDEGVEVGAGTVIWHFSHLIRGSRVGRNCRIGQNVVIGPNANVGDRVKIQNNVSVYEGVELEDYVFCGPSMVFTNVLNPRSAIPRMNELRRTLVRRGASLGANCTVVCGHTIGRYAFVGAGAVVTRDVPDYALVTGVPAKVTGWMCECGLKLDFRGKRTAACSCGLKYRKTGQSVEPLG
ncbi:MAG TPA: Gfo/Idh/MocA family oxidoreductase [bacterium]|uniref:UDP-2-acetamido-3-amino-2, 3-dideoxy-D-glucuronate N-acetyltransferase n=1 Tax=candidate division TA06 bacterium ADurb.Bin417 TaxID=1852828 RepID=A0A1V5MI69_UNCT6|nr:MAG: UDP-2-acetamido-3-amino-2,3-dideoxy-D-glucuronate N-acetyltransferase [candidate division TA06 bacterium ADurb.Bin417]HNQ34558.1 Gfo/Idh/MocA family oxidoreductase [bacterium]HNS49242.1 Gfo/Idh/MocA family oxidoreductase [bacterium]